MKEIYVIKISYPNLMACIDVSGYYHDCGRIREFDTYKEAQENIHVFTGLVPDTALFQVEKYFKLIP